MRPSSIFYILSVGPVLARDEDPAYRSKLGILTAPSNIILHVFDSFFQLCLIRDGDNSSV